MQEKEPVLPFGRLLLGACRKTTPAPAFFSSRRPEKNKSTSRCSFDAARKKHTFVAFSSVGAREQAAKENLAPASFSHSVPQGISPQLFSILFVFYIYQSVE